MNQMTFSDMEYSGRKRVTQKEKFLREMNEIIPWADWVSKILPSLLLSAKWGRRAVPNQSQCPFSGSQFMQRTLIIYFFEGNSIAESTKIQGISTD